MKTKIIHEIESELKVTLESIEKAYPSIYSKQDVMKLLDGFAGNIILWVSEAPEEKTQGLAMTEDGIKDLIEQLTSAIDKRVGRLDSNEVVDFDSASFEINYNNQVELESIDFNTDNITEEIFSAVDGVIHDYFTALHEVAPKDNETPYATEQ